MKLKYIFASIVATLALAVSCTKEADQFLNEVKVSSSYLAFPAAGGSVNVTVTATDSWSISELPEWVSASTASGSAGEVNVTFTAPAAESTREASFKIVCAGKTQLIKALQVTEEKEPEIISVAQALAAIKAVDKGDGGTYNLSGTYYVKGIVCRIQDISTQYGNATYWISDDGKYSADGVLQVYRGLWLEGGAFTKGDEFAVGDELTIAGQLMSYKGTPETAEKTAYVVSISKSLIGIEGVELLDVEEGEGITEFPLEGGSIKVSIMTKGNGFHVEIPAEAKSWLHIDDFGSDYVTLAADANEGGDRSVSVAFTTEADGTTYSCEQAFTQKGAIIAATVKEFLDAAVGTTLYKVTGVITSVANAGYGNVNLKDFSGEVYVYGIGAKGDFEKLGLKEGDIVTLIGQRGEHNGSAQMSKAQYDSHIAVTTVTVAEFLAAAESKEVFYRITGKVTKPTEEGTKWDIETYGNLNLTDASGSVYVYGVSTGVGGEIKKFGTLGVKEGDTMTIIGYRTSHNGLNQVGGGMYVSHEAAGEGGGEEKKTVVLSGAAKIEGGNNNYNGTAEVTQNEITWIFGGNVTTEPWRIGGKSIENTDRLVFTKTKIGLDVASVAVEHGGITVTSVNSLKLIVSANEDFSSPISELTGTVTADATCTFARPEGKSWKDCYFKLVYNVTVTDTSNKYVQVKKVTLSE